MGTEYHSFQISLTDGQKVKLKRAINKKAAVSLRRTAQQIGRGETLFLTQTQINHLKKAAAAAAGAVLKLSQTQIPKMAQRGGSLLSSLVSIAAPFVKSAAKSALKEEAKAGVSWGAEKALNKILGSGHWGPREMERFTLEKRLTPTQRKTLEQYLIGKGMVKGGSATQHGGFLGMLASIGVPLAIRLVKSLIRKGMQVGPSRSRRSVPRYPPPPPPSTGGKGMQINPAWYQSPPVVGTWDEKKKMGLKFKDVPLSNVDLTNWCKALQVPIKGIFSRDEYKPLYHSPCILNLDDLGSLGTHWVACWPGEAMEYFDSFGQHPPLEWEKEMQKVGITSFLRNDQQIQTIDSVRCGNYCLMFLNERNQGTGYEEILNMFSRKDLQHNEEVIRQYFSQSGGALVRRKPTLTDKIAYASSMFVNPTASWGSAFRLLGSQALKGVTDNVKYATAPPITSTLPYLTPQK